MITIDNLKEQLIKEKYLTSDSFQSPDRTYIFLDEKDNNIKFVEMNDYIYPFNLDIYENITFRKVIRKYNIILD